MYFNKHINKLRIPEEFHWGELCRISEQKTKQNKNNRKPKCLPVAMFDIAIQSYLKTKYLKTRQLIK